MKLVILGQLKKKKNIIALLVFFLTLVVIFFFDRGLSIGLGLLVILSALTFLVLQKLGFKDRKIYLLFLIVLFIHLGTTLIMHYTSFQPFSGGKGDYLLYQKSAINFSQNFKHGNFSFEDITLANPGLYAGHYYPAIIGAIYTLTLPEEIIGLMLNVWLVAVTIIFVYLIILEIGGDGKNALIIGIITALYPSYVFNTGLLLKDGFEIFFTILGLLFLIKTIKSFSWVNFIILYLAILCSTHFRFYIGYALIITFVLSWFLFSKFSLKDRSAYGLIFIIVLGFVPQISAGQSYYGIDTVLSLINPRMVSFYRQSAYNPNSTYNNPIISTPAASTPIVSAPTVTPSVNSTIPSNSVVSNPTNTNPISQPQTPIGLGSSFQTEGGLLGYTKSFVYVLLGPLPWQIRNLRQVFALFETIPWYLLLLFVADGIIICFKNRNKIAAPLLIFSLIVAVVIAIFDSNYGLIVRIRIPAFVSLLCLASFGFNKNNIIYNYLNKIYEKIFGYWGSWFYRLKHS